MRDVKGRTGRYELEIASPCCERFSITGHGDGRSAIGSIIDGIQSVRFPRDVARVISTLNGWHEKIGLVLEPLRVLLENSSARFVIWEQVPTVLPIWRASSVLLQQYGWSVDVAVVNAKQYGVPQSRSRAILLGRRDGKTAAIPSGKDLLPRVMADVLDHPKDWIQRSNYSASGSAGRRTAAERGRSMRTMQEPSVTITPRCFSWVLPDGSLKSCSVNDQRRLQTFPEQLQLAGGISAQRLQIGNAVPCRLAWALLREVAK